MVVFFKNMFVVLLQSVRLGLVWTMAASLAWFLFLGVDAGFGKSGELLLLSFDFVVRQTTPVVVGLHLVCAVASQYTKIRFGKLLAATCFGILAIPSVSNFVTIMTGGDWISLQPWVGVFVSIMEILLTAVLILILHWHLELCFAPYALSLSSLKPGLKLFYRLIVLLGMSFTPIVYCYYSSTLLGAYVDLSLALVPIAVFIVGTLGVAPLVRLKGARSFATVLISGIYLLVCVYITGMEKRAYVKGNGRAQLAKMTSLYDIDTGNMDVQFVLRDLTIEQCQDLAKHHYIKVKKDKAMPLVPKNILLISIDALRPEMLNTIHKGRQVAPNLAAIAKKSVFFKNTHASYPATLFSIGGSLTGQAASDILFSPVLPDNVFQLTKHRFKNRNIFLPSNLWFRMPVLKKLFTNGATAESFEDPQKQTVEFISTLKKNRKKSKSQIAWIHYFEPHPPYKLKKGHEFGRDKKEKYFSEVSYVDEEIGIINDYLEKNNWYDDTLVIFFSDHGGALGENGHWGHHVYLNTWNTGVLMMMRAPGLKPKIIESGASGLDIGPTVMHALGIGVENNWDGISLFDRMKENDDSLIISEAFPLRGKRLFKFANEKEYRGLKGLRTKLDYVQTKIKNYIPKVSIAKGELKLIVNRMTGEEELYNDALDPQNKTNLLGWENQFQTDYMYMKSQLVKWHEDKSLEYFCQVVWQRKNRI